MTVKFQDYYETLGVQKTATEQEIRKAYRKLARKYHPDVNKSKDAEDKFKKITEAYEVLDDKEKRSRYDQFGQGYHAGQEFRPPPGFDFQGGSFRFQEGDGAEFGFSGFSDFFETLFGDSNASPRMRSSRRAHREAEADRPRQEIELPLTLEEAVRRGAKRIAIERIVTNPDGTRSSSTKTLDVQIPAGITDGMVMRLKDGADGADLHLRIKLLPHARFTPEGADIVSNLPVSPWELALGAGVEVQTMNGALKLNIPAGSQSGQRLRVRGKGLPKKDGTSGDLYFVLDARMPKVLSQEEQEAFKRLAAVSKFNPRGN